MACDFLYLGIHSVHSVYTNVLKVKWLNDYLKDRVHYIMVGVCKQSAFP